MASPHEAAATTVAAWRMQAERLEMAVFDDGLIAFDHTTGQTHRLSAAHGELLQTLAAAGAMSESDIAQALFGECEEDDLSTIHNAMQELAHVGFVEPILASAIDS